MHGENDSRTYSVKTAFAGRMIYSDESYHVSRISSEPEVLSRG